MPAEVQPRRSRWPEAALVFACCAALAAWNPFAAPVGLVVGTASALVGWRAAKTQRGSRRIALWAAALGSAAVVASAIVLLLSAGALSTELAGQPVVPGRTPAEVRQLLDDAERRTRRARARAAEELGYLAGPEGEAGHDGGRSSTAGEKKRPQ